MIATPSTVTAIDSHPHLVASDLPVAVTHNHLQSTLKNTQTLPKRMRLPSFHILPEPPLAAVEPP
jgi:hypothetical protein